MSRRAGPLTVIWVPDAPTEGAPGPPSAALGFAIGRRVGGSVVRNRVRRRLRAAAAEIGLAPGCYLVIASPEAAGLSWDELRRLLRQAVAALPR